MSDYVGDLIEQYAREANIRRLCYPAAMKPPKPKAPCRPRSQQATAVRKRWRRYKRRVRDIVAAAKKQPNPSPALRKALGR